MGKQWRGFFVGFLSAILVFCLGTPAFASTVRQLEASYSGIRIILDGVEVTPEDVNGNPVEPFAVKGTTYLPVRAVAEALGLGVSWDGATQTVVLTRNGMDPVLPNSGSNTGSYGSINGTYFDISVIDLKWTDALETSLYTVTPQKDGTKLLCLIFSCKNTTDKLRNLGGLRAYADGSVVLPATAVGSVDDAIPFVGAVHGGMETQTYSIWELPENCTTFQLYYYEADGSENNQNILIDLKDFY